VVYHCDTATSLSELYLLLQYKQAQLLSYKKNFFHHFPFSSASSGFELTILG
jgi:hypothetical protein